MAKIANTGQVASTRHLPRVTPHPVQRNSGTMEKNIPRTPPEYIAGEESGK